MPRPKHLLDTQPAYYKLYYVKDGTNRTTRYKQLPHAPYTNIKRIRSGSFSGLVLILIFTSGISVDVVKKFAEDARITDSARYDKISRNFFYRCISRSKSAQLEYENVITFVNCIDRRQIISFIIFHIAENKRKWQPIRIT